MAEKQPLLRPPARDGGYLEVGGGGPASGNSSRAPSPTELGIPVNVPLLDGGEEDGGGTGKLSMFFGVIVPNILSIFSVILFLRIGFCVSQAGYLMTIGMFFIAYAVCGFTIQSLSAISTNGAVKGGGVYFMISRALGPRFGGSIGFLYVFANVSASALYHIGLVEALVSTFGPGGNITDTLETDRWLNFAYASGVLFFCLIVCLIGADFFAKTTFGIFVVVVSALATVFISFGIVDRKEIATPNDNTRFTNSTVYSGFSTSTFRGNLYPDFGVDYSTNTDLDFAAVFAVLFNGCTGFMAGANVSGDLKNPSKAIPKGTFFTAGFTLFVYLVLVTLVCFTSERDLLKNNYQFIQDTDIYPPIIAFGIVCATLSAGLSTLIGASRVLQALAKDRIFPSFFNIFAKGINGVEEPHYAVLGCWFIVQLLLLAGEINTIAPIVSIFFLLAYSATNLACLLLEWASAPNWRPSFRYFSWHTCLLGVLATLGLMFMVNVLYSVATLFIVAVLYLYISYRAPVTNWGYISQALIYHQVRKYLLQLDERKQHVKYWRPQLLAFAGSPNNLESLAFLNLLKKGGLYIVGHVVAAPLDQRGMALRSARHGAFLAVKDKTKVKAFCKTVVDDTVRHGARSLMAAAGLNGMTPNTMVFGLHGEPSESSGNPDFEPGTFAGPGALGMDEYCGMLHDANQLGHNVLVTANFAKIKQKRLIHVWFLPTGDASFDRQQAVILVQFAAILNSTSTWFRAAICVHVGSVDLSLATVQTETMNRMLHSLRIRASATKVQLRPSHPQADKPDENAEAEASVINAAVAAHSASADVVLVGVPEPPGTEDEVARYVQSLKALALNLPPLVMVYGQRGDIAI